MKPLIIAYLGNIIDTVATLYLYSQGGRELNPFMAMLLKSPWMFAVVKISVVTLVVIRLWTCRESKNARIAAWVAAAIFGALSLYYCVIFAIYAILCV